MKAKPTGTTTSTASMWGEIDFSWIDPSGKIATDPNGPSQFAKPDDQSHWSASPYPRHKLLGVLLILDVVGSKTTHEHLFLNVNTIDIRSQR